MTRRHALASAAALFGLPAPAQAGAASLPDASIAVSDPEKYWARIRKEQFYLPDWRAFLNNGSLGVAPRPVLEAVTDYLLKGAALLLPDGEYPRWGYETLDAHREELADYLGCKKDQLALVHNATEALSTIAAGIDLERGDEVVMTDQEHTSGKAGWAMRQARHGIAVREVAIPLPPKSPEQLADLLVSAIGPKTKVLFFSAITTHTGLVFPVRKICDAARAKGVITVVDGAHLNGQLGWRLDELGCDYYAGSPHKWMFAPAGCGILYGREDALDRLWPSIVTGAWDDKSRKAARFMMMGTNNRAIFEGMVAGVRFAKAIGPERIYARIHQLAKSFREKAAKMDKLEVLTPEDDRMYGSLVAFNLRGVDQERFARLAKERKIWISGGKRVRVSAHIHTRPQDLELLIETLSG
jgi:selenocysteine lyase/cysteine desulfurase